MVCIKHEMSGKYLYFIILKYLYICLFVCLFVCYFDFILTEMEMQYIFFTQHVGDVECCIINVFKKRRKKKEKKKEKKVKKKDNVFNQHHGKKKSNTIKNIVGPCGGRTHDIRVISTTL